MEKCVSGECLGQEAELPFVISYDGIWSGVDAGAHHYFDKALSEKLVQFFTNHNASSVIDLGAGKGDYAAALMSKGIFTSCYDGNQQTSALTEGRCGVTNLVKPINLNKHEWVLSLGVGEYLPKEYEVQFISNLHNVNTKGIVLSWAVVGQNGEGHVNCQNNDYIKAKFAALGYLNDLEAEKELRNGQTNWFKNTLMVFVKDVQKENAATVQYVMPTQSSEVKFCIIVPSYNNEKYVILNMKSIILQEYKNWRMIYIDDYSTDKTGEMVIKIKNHYSLNDSKVQLITHQSRVGSAIYSIHDATHNFCQDDEVMVTVDGDDALASRYVLSKLADVYKSGQIWMTYGQFVTIPNGQLGFSKEFSEESWKDLRHAGFVASHLRTCYTWLFKKINTKDLQRDGAFLKTAWDVAYLMPMLEMSGRNKVQFISEITYLYRMHENNDHVLRLAQQKSDEAYIRSLPKYDELSFTKYVQKEPITAQLTTTTQKADVSFCIIAPSYNNEKYVMQHMRSIILQDYQNWRMIYVNDQSSDKTAELVMKIKNDYKLDDNKIKFVTNQERMGGAMKPIYNAAHDFCKDNEVMITVDGDDALSSKGVLSKVADIYRNNDVWITYGEFILMPKGDLGECRELTTNEWKNLRNSTWVTSHLRTNYVWLFKKIDVKDLQMNGRFFTGAPDIAYMFPILEMAGPEHVKFISDATYLYRIHEHNCNMNEPGKINQKNEELYIRALPRYDRLPYKPQQDLNPCVVEVDDSKKGRVQNYIEVMLMGGVGNQLFQYALALSLAKHNKVNVIYLNKRFYNLHKDREYMLDNFNLTQCPIITNDIESIKSPVIYTERFHHFDEQVFNLTTPLKITGYFQSEKYFLEIENIIHDQFQLAASWSTRASIYLKQIQENDASVCVHIRRGDYVNNPSHEIDLTSYYQASIQKIHELERGKTKYFFFSDDIEYVKKTFDYLPGSIFINGDLQKPFEDLFLMSKCKHNIIANSSFSWWAAWLNTNPNKIVISPKEWFGPNLKHFNTQDVLPAGWIALDSKSQDASCKVGILYIATGRYIIFWKDFYDSFEKYFLKQCEKTYFLFTDRKELQVPSNVIKIEQQQLPWPLTTLLRFNLFLRAKNLLEKLDYIYFINANILAVQDIGAEILPSKDQGLVATLHPGYMNKPRTTYTYDTNPRSLAYISNNEGKHYFCGGFNGGRSKEYLQLIENLDRVIRVDLSNNTIALWHDESHLNRYMIDYMKEKSPLILNSSYAYPESTIVNPYTKLLIQRKDSARFGGHDYLRGKTDTKEP